MLKYMISLVQYINIIRNNLDSCGSPNSRQGAYIYQNVSEFAAF